MHPDNFSNNFDFLNYLYLTIRQPNAKCLQVLCLFCFLTTSVWWFLALWLQSGWIKRQNFFKIHLLCAKSLWNQIHTKNHDAMQYWVSKYTVFKKTPFYHNFGKLTHIFKFPLVINSQRNYLYVHVSDRDFHLTLPTLLHYLVKTFKNNPFVFLSFFIKHQLK